MKDDPKKPNEQPWIPDRYYYCFQEAVSTYEQNHSHWHIETLISLIKWGIQNLKQTIEDSPAGKVSWDEPTIELHFPIKWDWNSPHDGDRVYGKQSFGEFTEENTANKEILVKTLADMMRQRFYTMALAHFTNGAWFEKRQNTCTPYLPHELDKEVRQIRGHWKKREALEAIFKPFWIGTTRIDFPDGTHKPNARIPARVAKQLERANQHMDIRGISFKGKVNGRKIWCGLVFEIQPLIVDYDKKEAYHAITTGLAFKHKMIGDEIVSLTPSTWPKRDRDIFWSEILQGLDKSTKRLIPKSKPQSLIVLLDKNNVSRMRPLYSPADLKVAKDFFAAFQTEIQKAEKLARQRKKLLHLLQVCEAAKTAIEKGRSLESLVAELFNTVPGLKVVKRNVRTQTEEIDLVISNHSHDREFKDEGSFFLAECKKWSDKCGKDEFVLFKDKVHNRKRCKLGFLISWNGFARTIPKVMIRSSSEWLLIVPLDGNQIRDAVKHGSFHSILKTATRDATLL